MTLLDDVRLKYKTAPAGTDKTDTSPSVSSVSSHPGESVTTGNPSVSSVSAHLAQFATALRIGRLVLCRRCQHFEHRRGEQPDGVCATHGPTWATVPFACPDYTASPRREVPV